MADFSKLDAVCHAPDCTKPGEYHIDVRDGGTLGMLCQGHLDQETFTYMRSAMRNLKAANPQVVPADEALAAPPTARED